MIDNVFEGNLTQVSYGGRSTSVQTITPATSGSGNYWDDLPGL